MSVLVLLGDTPTAREDAIVVIVERLPPLEPFARTIVYGLADGARVGTLVGLIAFAWGASGFYLSLHGALDRVMPSERRRSSIVARIHGLLAVGLVVAAILASIVAGSLAAVEQVGTVIDRLGTLAILGPLVTPGLNLFQAVLVVIVVLRFVPTDPPPIRVALPGSIVAGVGIGLLTALFGLLAPFLVGELAGLGVIASVFIALIWFSWTFRILLYGAAIAGVRRDAARAQDLCPASIGAQARPARTAQGEQRGIWRFHVHFAAAGRSEDQGAGGIPAAPAMAQREPHAGLPQPREPGAQQRRGLHSRRKDAPARSHEGGLPEPLAPRP